MAKTANLKMDKSLRNGLIEALPRGLIDCRVLSAFHG
jgi:hypothetical protein